MITVEVAEKLHTRSVVGFKRGKPDAPGTSKKRK